MWEWLGEPLAADFANTTKRRGMAERECLRSAADLAEWARRQEGRVPLVAPDDDRLDEVLALRDAVKRVLHAAAAGSGRPASAIARVNEAARRVPLVAQLRGGRAVLEPAGDADPLDELLSRVAVSAIELSETGIGFCDAPGCGQFYARDRANQKWCSNHCGTRARVARHAARA
jgi:predicted RNA-binding Zn ribbon-like protein